MLPLVPKLIACQAPGELRKRRENFEREGEEALIPKSSFGLGLPSTNTRSGLDRYRVASTPHQYVPMSTTTGPGRSMSAAAPVSSKLPNAKSTTSILSTDSSATKTHATNVPDSEPERSDQHASISSSVADEQPDYPDPDSQSHSTSHPEAVSSISTAEVAMIDTPQELSHEPIEREVSGDAQLAPNMPQEETMTLDVIADYGMLPSLRSIQRTDPDRKCLTADEPVQSINSDNAWAASPSQAQSDQKGVSPDDVERLALSASNAPVLTDQLGSAEEFEVVTAPIPAELDPSPSSAGSRQSSAASSPAKSRRTSAIPALPMTPRLEHEETDLADTSLNKETPEVTPVLHQAPNFAASPDDRTNGSLPLDDDDKEDVANLHHSSLPVGTIEGARDYERDVGHEEEDTEPLVRCSACGL